MQLYVRFHDRPCGVLSIEDERMRFHYNADYAASGGPALSVALPLQLAPWPDALVFPFFENLLPEGLLRELLANELGTASNNFERLLAATGGDVAGALSLELENQAPPAEQAHFLDALSETALGEIVERIKTHPFLVDNTQGMRLSLAGAQNKLPIILDAQGKVHLPGKHPSTHILKPPSERFPALVENEALCMRAAARAGLRVPEVTLVPCRNTDDALQDCYVVARYDRVGAAQGDTQRLHQEDACQILGTPSARKYAQDGGPGFGDLFRVLRQFSTPAAVQQQELVKRMLFNLLIGNQDAHGKNFSILHTGGHVVLSPAYDLVCTQVYESLSDRFAMPIGNAWQLRDLNGAALDAFRAETGVALRRQAGVLRRFIDTAEQALVDEAQTLQQETLPASHSTLAHVVRIAQRNALQLRQWLA